ncbi:MAG: alpha/beta hydrolase [Bacteroidetes bacterium]|nr:alpha/beta hydrolase [Bacteroidota bacterium]
MKSLTFFSFIILLCACQPPKPPEIKYTVTGHGEKTLFFVHGWCINGSYWDSQVAAFQDRYRVVTVDLAGHGASKVTREDWSFDRYAQDVVNVIQYLDLKNVILIGHSMSGSIITRVSLTMPDRVIALIGIDNFNDVAAPLDSVQESQIAQLIEVLKTNYRETAVAISSASLFSPTTDSSVIKRVLNDIENADPATSASTIESVTGESKVEGAILKKLKLPLWLINSDRNSVNEEALKEYCPKSYKIKWVSGTGHYPMIENPEEFNARLDEFLSELH